MSNFDVATRRTAELGAVNCSYFRFSLHEIFWCCYTFLGNKKGRDLTSPMQHQIENIPIDIQNKKIPIQELTSALKGIEAAILE